MKEFLGLWLMFTGCLIILDGVAGAIAAMLRFAWRLVRPKRKQTKPQARYHYRPVPPEIANWRWHELRDAAEDVLAEPSTYARHRLERVLEELPP